MRSEVTVLQPRGPNVAYNRTEEMEYNRARGIQCKIGL